MKVPWYNRPVILLLQLYKSILSPILPSVCRFDPSCSVYARQCFERYGSAKAAGLTLKRLLRCHPFGSYGSDPVPEKTQKHL